MKKVLFLALAPLLLMTYACDNDDDPVVPNAEEVITTLTYTLTSDLDGSDVVFKFQDLDGDGGNAPVITEGSLAANTSYSGKLDLLNESESPAESITEEIQLEDEEHQFFFEISGAGGMTVSYDDRDSDGNPLGLATKLTTLEASTGTLTITLRHEPNKTAAGVASGDIANAGGETDIEVTFEVDIQ